MSSVVIGIDGGLNGGIACAFGGGRFAVWPMPTVRVGKSKRLYDEQYIRQTLSFLDATHAFIEFAQAMIRPGRKQNLSSTFKTGDCYGFMRGILVGLGIPHEVVRPKAWQSTMLTGVDKSETKRASIIVAKRLFPDVSLKRTDKCRVDSDGMADALLIAEYGRRRLCAKE